MQSTGSPQDARLAFLFPRTLTKAEKRKIQILEATIACYATRGVESTTYEHIAEACGASRSLVIHYFPDKEELSKLVIQFIRGDMQDAAIAAIQLAKTPEKQLAAYVTSTFTWVKNRPNYATVWLLLYYYCRLKKDWKASHTDLTTMGKQRLVALMQTFPQNQKVPAKELALRAKVIQSNITGALIVVHTENLTVDEASFQAETVRQCLRIAKGE